MKTLRVAVFALALAVATAALAQDTNVYSRNAVGFIKVSAPRGQFTLLGTPFNQVGGTNSFQLPELLGTNVPAGTAAYIFTTGQTYQVYTYDADDGWPTGVQVIRGQGVFVKIPDTYAQTNFDFFIMGEVPGTNYSFALTAGFTPITFAFPVETAVTNTALNSIASPGDTLAVWRNTWQFYTYDADDGWPTSVVLKPGEAYFYRTTNPKTWEEIKTRYYTWP